MTGRNPPEFRPIRREELRRRDHAYDGSGSMYTFLLGLLLFLLIAALSVWQLTAQETADRLTRRGIVSLTDIDTVIAESRPELERLATAGQPVSIPGYPLDVALEPDEATRPDAELREIVLARSSELIYSQGLRAFDRTGDQSLSLFSSQGILERFISLLSKENHDRAGIAVYVLGALTGLAAFGAIVRNRGYGKLRSPGVAALVAGLAGLVLFGVIVKFLFGQWWGGGDPFQDEVSGLVDDAIGIFRLNFIIAGALGIFLIVVSLVCTLLEERAGGRAAADDVIGW